MSVKSSLPRRPVLSLFSTTTERAGWHPCYVLAVQQAWWSHSLGQVHCADPLLPSLGLSVVHHRQPGPDLLHPCPALEPWIFRYAPAHQRLRLWIQLPTMLKGQGPPATLSICQARPPESRIRKERDANSRKPQLWAQPNTEDEKMDFYVGCSDPKEKHQLFQVKLCLVSPWAVDPGFTGTGASTWIF